MSIDSPYGGSYNQGAAQTLVYPLGVPVADIAIAPPAGYAQPDIYTLAAQIVADSVANPLTFDYGVWPMYPLTAAAVAAILQLIQSYSPTLYATIWNGQSYAAAELPYAYNSRMRVIRGGGGGGALETLPQSASQDDYTFDACAGNGLPMGSSNLLGDLLLVGGLAIAAITGGSLLVGAAAAPAAAPVAADVGYSAGDTIGISYAAAAASEEGTAAVVPAVAAPAAAGGTAAAGAGVTAAGTSAMSGAVTGGEGAVFDTWNAALTASPATLASLSQASQGMWASLKAGLYSLWDDYLHEWMISAGDFFGNISDWFAETFSGLFDFLDNVMSVLNSIYKKIIKPILNVLQIARKFLTVFKMMGLQWAVKLDQDIQYIETQISKNFLLIRGYLTQVIAVCNALGDPSQMVKLIAVSVKGQSAMGGLCREMTGLPLGMFFASSSASAPGWAKPVTRTSQLNNPLTNPPASQLLNQVPSAVLLDPTTGLAQVSDDDVDVDDIADYFQEMRDRMQAAQDAIDNASAVDLDITAATGDGDDTVTSTVAFFTAAVSDDTEA